MKRILFLIRKADRPSNYSFGSFGLSNSATFVANRLNQEGHIAKVVMVHDNSDIDREVTDFAPDVIIVEALWVVPNKFNELLKIHRYPRWVVRVHSKAPFLAMEGVAMDWLREYVDIGEVYGNLRISTNNLQFNDELELVQPRFHPIYLPNIYQPTILPFRNHRVDDKQRPLDIGCFGAIRPFKNQLAQAMAAIMFGNAHGRKINFHINATRQEQQGYNVYKNLVGLFKGTEHALMEHDWYGHHEFATHLVGQMDLGMQVSFSESFNIVTADFVNAGVPILVSDDVHWMPAFSRCNPNSSFEMSKKLYRLFITRNAVMENADRRALHHYNEEATKSWKNYLKS